MLSSVWTLSLRPGWITPHRLMKAHILHFVVLNLSCCISVVTCALANWVHHFNICLRSSLLRTPFINLDRTCTWSLFNGGMVPVLFSTQPQNNRLGSHYFLLQQLDYGSFEATRHLVEDIFNLVCNVQQMSPFTWTKFDSCRIIWFQAVVLIWIPSFDVKHHEW